MIYLVSGKVLKKKEKEKKENIAKCSNNTSTVLCDVGLSDTGFLFKKTIFRTSTQPGRCYTFIHTECLYNFPIIKEHTC